MFLPLPLTDPTVSVSASIATVGGMFQVKPWLTKPALGGGCSLLSEFLFFFWMFSDKL